MRQLSEFFAPTNWSPENRAKRSQLADKTKIRKPRMQRKDATNWFYVIKHNAQLRGEARNTDVTVLHFNTETTAYQKCHAC